MALNIKDKEDIKQIMHTVIATDVTPRFDRLEQKIASNHSIVVRHVLDTMKQVADLQKDHTQLKEKLASAVS